MKNTKDFIKRAIDVHGNKYNYSKSIYTGAIQKLLIICPVHGEFSQTPNNHYASKGCIKCHYSIIESDKDFIDKAQLVHGNKYDYSLINYINTNEKICILCKEHGLFKQSPKKHLIGQGCPKCIGKNLTNNEIILKCKNIHNNQYDYSLSFFKKVRDKMIIICKNHGCFNQTVFKHLLGQGCPKCAFESGISKGEQELVNYIKLIYNKDIITNSRDIIYPYELDVYLPELKIGFEFNGIYWHKLHEVNKPGYHKRKAKLCKDKGITLINILDLNWSKNVEKCKIKIKNKIK